MAFTNLFTTLAAVEGDDKSPGEAAFKCREQSKTIKRGKARKREPQGGQAGPAKKRHDQAQTITACNDTLDDCEAVNYHIQSTDGKHTSVGSPREVTQSTSSKAGHNDVRDKGQSNKTKNNRNMNKQQQQQKRKMEWQKNQHQQKYRGRAAQRGGGHQARSSLRDGRGNRKYKNDEQDFEVKRKRHMTQEFKDQNALLVDGRLLCRHFLRGKCIKGDDCQLEHIQAYNDLLKELCKFYVQGSCTKGDSCPYMHNSFPCKFFHRKGKCSQGADCRFSHEPLTDVTNRLLEEELKRENDLYLLAKNAEQESSRQAANTDESEITEANITPDALTQPLRLNFYKSADRNAENEALLCQTEELAENMEEAVQPHATDAAQPHSAASTNHQEPVCYSVEAVLGPQLSKQFPTFSTTPRSQDSAPLSSSDRTSGSAHQTQVPYSVDAVLRSYKSVEKSSSGHTPAPLTAQMVSYSPETDFQETADPRLSSETQNEDALYLENARNGENESQEKMFKSLPSLPTQSRLISEACPSHSVASWNHNKQGVKMPESLKLALRASPGAKLELLPTDVTRSVNCSSEDPLPSGPTKQKSIFSRPPTQTSISRHPTHLKSRLSVLTSDPQASFQPFCASAGVTEFKAGAAASAEPNISSMKSSDSENPVSLHSATKQPTEIHLHPKKTRSGLQLGTTHLNSAERTAESSSEMAPCGDLAVGCKKTLKTPFSSLFAKPISNPLQPKDDCQSSSCPPSLIQSPCPATQSEDCKSDPDKACSRSFLSLFAAPLSAAPLPGMQSQPVFPKSSSCSQQSFQLNDNTSHLSDSKQRADIREVLGAPRCPNSSPHFKKDSTERINRPTKQLVNRVCHTASDSLPQTSNKAAGANSPSTTHAHQRPADVSPHKGSTASSVLKTLFVRLSPYHQDGE